MPRDEFLTIDQVATELGVARSTFYRWRRLGPGPGVVEAAQRLDPHPAHRAGAVPAGLPEQALNLQPTGRSASADRPRTTEVPPWTRPTTSTSGASRSTRVRSGLHTGSDGWWREGCSPNRSRRLALADAFRAKLLTAAREGFPFDTETGLPERMIRKKAVPKGPTVYEHLVEYAEMKWPRLAPNSRSGVAETLAVVAPVLTRDLPGRPDPVVLRRALYRYAFNFSRVKDKAPQDITEALEWIARSSIPLERPSGCGGGPQSA